MKKTLLLTLAAAAPSLLMAQSAMDGFSFSQSDIKGTARFMSMGGAFGALGGDLTTLGQNPGGIGVYRNNEIGFTLELDPQSTKSVSLGSSTTADKTHFYFNNGGFVSSIRTSGALRNFNIGFTYNRAASFNRSYKGSVPQLSTSVSNYIAGVANAYGVTPSQISSDNDPYYNNTAPWLTILGYYSYLISPEQSGTGETTWFGQYENGKTTGSGTFEVREKGEANEFNIALGGNFCNKFYWGMDFCVSSFNYSQRSYWGESLENAWIPGYDDSFGYGRADFGLSNIYKAKGTGFSYKLGFIYRPFNELRLGIAMHTPTWYSVDESYIGAVDYNYSSGIRPGQSVTNNGLYGEYDYNFRTPWRLIVSVATVVGGRFILSADYEAAFYSGMHFSDKYYDEDYYLGGGVEDPYLYTNQDIKAYYKTQNTLRVGAEVRVTPNFYLRAGYALQSSPVKADVHDGKAEIYTAGTRTGYTLDDRTNYICGGLGFRSGGFYTDLAYVYRNRKSSYHPFPADVENPGVAPSVALTSISNQVVLSLGYKF